MGLAIRSRVVRDTYRDSVELMRVAAEVERLPGVARAALVIATPANRTVLAEAGLLEGDATEAGANDLVIAVGAEDAAGAEEALAQADRLLRAQPRVAAGSQGGGAALGAPAPAPRTIAEATDEMPEANLAMISTPGTYATAEAFKALKRGMHVFLFSDNVPLADEIELKALATRKGLLMMGPDCGTAILDGVPLGFANAVRRGRVGLVAASGTGLQQVTCLVDRLGEGVSQAIGVGGRDLDERVGGMMMLAGIERLVADPYTAVIVLLSKPPAPAVMRRVLEATRGRGTPVVVNFLGGDAAAVAASGAAAADTLEEAAELAVALAHGGGVVVSADEAEQGLAPLAQALAAQAAPGQRLVRGLYSGGTLCKEAAHLLAEMLGEPGMAGQTLLDLGDDEFTVGRPHPMIDFRLRNEKIVAAAEDPATAVILVDVVLGYGAHPDPAGELIPAVREARARADAAGRVALFLASVCGASGDPQGIEQQEARLAKAGVILQPSNARAARLAGLIVRAVEGGSAAPSQPRWAGAPLGASRQMGHPDG